MLLSNVTLRARTAVDYSDRYRIVVEPLAPDAIQPGSIDVHLGKTVKRWEGPRLDTRVDNSRWWRPYPATEPGGGWLLAPGRFYLGVLREFIKMPPDLTGHLWNNSSGARDGVLPHLCAGLLDATWAGWATLEIVVFACETVVYPGDRIGQVEFCQLDHDADPGYEGRYQGDREPTPARLVVAS